MPVMERQCVVHGSLDATCSLTLNYNCLNVFLNPLQILVWNGTCILRYITDVTSVFCVVTTCTYSRTSR
jgi:hypothetical protein